MKKDKKPFIRKQSELRKVKESIPDKTEEAIDAVDKLIQDAHKAGYDNVLDYTKATYQTWDKNVQLHVLDEIYESFFNAVDKKQTKEPWGIGVWNTASTFKEFLFLTTKEIKFRLEELDRRKASQIPAFAGMEKYLPDMTNVAPGIGEALTQENYEFLSLILHRTKELVDMVLRNEDKYNEMLNELDQRAKQKLELETGAVIP